MDIEALPSILGIRKRFRVENFLNQAIECRKKFEF